MLLPRIAVAGFDEGFAAYEKKDYTTALQEFTPLARQGYASAQYNLGLMHDKGQGLPQNDKEAVKWFRLAADKGHASTQANLGVMYEYGKGVDLSRVVAYAFYSLSAKADSSDKNKAVNSLKRLAEFMSPKEINAAQELTGEMGAPGSVLKALDKYLAQPAMDFRRGQQMPQVR